MPVARFSCLNPLTGRAWLMPQKYVQMRRKRAFSGQDLEDCDLVHAQLVLIVVNVSSIVFSVALVSPTCQTTPRLSLL